MRNDPLFESLTALGQLAMRESGAAGYGLYRLDSGTGVLVRLQMCGARLDELATSLEFPSAVSFPARVSGVDTHVLTFVFRDETISEDSLKRLDRIVSILEGVLKVSMLPARYAALAAHTAEMEAQLAYAKIRDRARGLIRSGAYEAEALSDFAETVLRPRQTATILEQLAVEREEELQERSLTTQAKAVLESVYGMSEEQAHHHLRVASRKSRRPLKDVALEFIGKRS